MKRTFVHPVVISFVPLFSLSFVAHLTRFSFALPLFPALDHFQIAFFSVITLRRMMELFRLIFFALPFILYSFTRPFFLASFFYYSVKMILVFPIRFQISVIFNVSFAPNSLRFNFDSRLLSTNKKVRRNLPALLQFIDA